MVGIQNLAEKLNIGIVGGGYAGMAAAVALAERGIPVTVFESARQLGGRARGVMHNDMQLDNGQHLLLGCYRQTLRLIEQVGGNIEQDFLRLPLQLDLHGEFSFRAPRLPAPLHLIEQLAIRVGWQTTPTNSLVILAALLNAQGLPFGARLAAVRFMLALRRMSFRLTKDMTVADLLAQHGQHAELTQKLWEPLCIAALNTPIQKASARVLLNVLRDALNQSRGDSDMLLPRMNFTALLPQRAADYVERRGGKVCTSCGVEALRPVENGIELASTQGTKRFSHAICAAPPTVAAKLLHPIAGLEDTAAQINGLEHQPIYTVYLRYPAHITLPHPMIGLHRRFSQWLFDKGQIAGQHGLLAAVISAEGLHQELPHEQLAQKVIAELREEFGITESPEWFKVIAEKRATFCCAPNLQRPMQQTALPRLLLAGDYTAGDYPATLEGAVASGLRCAGLISGQR